MLQSRFEENRVVKTGQTAGIYCSIPQQRLNVLKIRPRQDSAFGADYQAAT